MTSNDPRLGWLVLGWPTLPGLVAFVPTLRFDLRLFTLLHLFTLVRLRLVGFFGPDVVVLGCGSLTFTVDSRTRTFALIADSHSSYVAVICVTLHLARFVTLGRTVCPTQYALRLFPVVGYVAFTRLRCLRSRVARTLFHVGAVAFDYLNLVVGVTLHLIDYVVPR